MAPMSARMTSAQWSRARWILFTIALACCGCAIARGQESTIEPSHFGPPLALNERRYTLQAGEAVAIPAASETLDFALRATRLSVSVGAQERSGFAIGPNAQGDQLLLAASLRTQPGEYWLQLSAISGNGETRVATIDVVLHPMAAVPSSAAGPPVVF